MKENVPGPMFYDPSLTGVILLSLMGFVNVITLGIWFQIPHLTMNHNLDMTLLVIALLSFNGVYYLRKKRYVAILEKYRKQNPSKKLVFSIITIAYSLLSYVLLIMVHSSR